MASTHTHPNPLTDRLAQVGGIVLVVVMILGALGQFVLATAGLPLFLLSGIVTLLLIAPVMMLTSATPAVSSVSTAVGITVLIVTALEAISALTARDMAATAYLVPL